MTNYIIKKRLLIITGIILIGIHIDPETSPVQPERFSGYHTGADFEQLEGEENDELPFFAICGGPILQKRSVSGYGGVLVQECLMNDNARTDDITVIYGHVNIQSIPGNIGDYLMPEEKVGILGKNLSEETGGERRHLHLGIHEGSNIDLRGYVQSESELSGWINPESRL